MCEGYNVDSYIYINVDGEHEPCLQNKIIQVYINYFDDKSISEKTKLYFDMFNQEKSAFLLCDGYSYNGKIFYYTHLLIR